VHQKGDLNTAAHLLIISIAINYVSGYDIGSSSIKVAIVEVQPQQTGLLFKRTTNEMELFRTSDWAEQDPEMWWQYIVLLQKHN
jgi:xylulokinase